MNISAVAEQKRNKQFITEHSRQGFRVLEVDTKNVSFRGYPWQSLNAFGKRKFENLIILENTKRITKIIYH